jgi:hypothetical protein
MPNYKPYISKTKKGHWTCPKHLPAIHMPLVSKTCWMCGTQRPLTQAEQKEKQEKQEAQKKALKAQSMLCAWGQCNKGTNNSRAERRGKSKYCSTHCKNSYARWSYRQRQKEKK